AYGCKVVELETGALVDELQQYGEARVAAALERDSLLDLEGARRHQNLRRRGLRRRRCNAVFGEHHDRRQIAVDGVLGRRRGCLWVVGEQLAAELEAAALERVAEPANHR